MDMHWDMSDLHCLNRIHHTFQSRLLQVCVTHQDSIHWRRGVLIAIWHSQCNLTWWNSGQLAYIMIFLLMNCILYENKEGHGLNSWRWWIQGTVGEQRLWRDTWKQRVVLLDDIVVHRTIFQFTINNKHTLYDVVCAIYGTYDSSPAIHVKTYLQSKELFY